MKRLLIIILLLAASVSLVSAETVYQLGPSGSGMIVRTSISGEDPGLLVNNSTQSLTTHDIVYLQFQDLGLMFLYLLLLVIFVVLFLWSIVTFREELANRRYDEENGV